MKSDDRELGMNRVITRRDFIHGVGVAVAGAAVPGHALAEASAALDSAPEVGTNYPPGLTGMRGSHPGSFEVAHQLAFQGKSDWPPAHDAQQEAYDLVVVGGGVSGLAAAYFFRDKHPDARILILENHDDFGGHAKRNEFSTGGASVVGYGGSQSLESPSAYSGIAKRLLQGLGVDIQRFYTAFDRDYYDSRGLGFGIYFDRARYGLDRMVRGSIFEETGFFSDESNSLSREDAIAQMPISENAQRELLSLYSIHEDRLPDVSVFSEPAYLKKISYRDFLAKHMGVTEPEVFALYQDAMSGYFGVGIDASSAFNHVMTGLPGLAATGLGRFQGVIQWIAERSSEPYIFHFPDGNSSVARLLVRSLIPGVASGSTMEDIVTQRFDYSQLDAAENPVRIRLGSTAVDVRHVGETASAKEVEITYIRGGRSHRVRAQRSVLACYGTMIPYICSGLPEAQRAALSSEVRVPLVYTNVLLRNWRAFEKIGIQFAYSPGRYHHFSMLDFPVSIGDYEFSKGPDDPILVHMSCALTAPNEGLTAREQHRKARYALLSRSFEEFEREIREHLAGMLAEGGFDPSRDIRAITVNRWPHGYAYDQNTLFDPEYEDDELPFVVGRKRFGRVTIANSDAGGEAYLDSAIDQAHRAVEDFDD